MARKNILAEEWLWGRFKRRFSTRQWVSMFGGHPIPLGGGVATEEVVVELPLVSSDGIDTRIISTAPDTNYGTVNVISHGYYGSSAYRLLLKFDVSSIPPNAQIVSAVLSLACLDASASNDTVRFYPVKVPWIESEVTWNSRITGTAWQTAGCSGANDRETVEIASISRLTSDTLGKSKSVVIPASLVQGWVTNPNSNYGLLGKGDNESTNSSGNICSSDHATEVYRPRLSVTYTVPAGSGTNYISRAITWLKVAQDANAAGGVSHWYTIGTGWYNQDYKEVSGYIINTLFDRYHATGEADLRTRAIALADWELTVQTVNAGWDANVFDTGQVILGLCRAYDETGTAGYKTSAITAGNWLLSFQEVDGSWIQNTYTTKVHTYDARVAWGLLRLWQITGDVSYKNAAIANLEWVLLQQNGAGWFANCGMFAAEDAAPLTHTISYTVRGLLEAGLILGNTDYLNAAKLTMDAFIGFQLADGRWGGGNFSSTWAATNGECLTGLAQMSICLWKYYNYSGTITYKTAAVSANRFLKLRQGVSVDTGIDGGLAGSYPIGGAYHPNTVLSWATKFLADALYLETTNGEHSGKVNG